MIVKISAIIEAYLQRENRLIIPSVGTLLKRKESGEIVFVEMLKKNDGKLVALVAEQFAVSAEEAEAIVEGYSEEIARQIATSRKFIIDGVGVLLVGANGALDFAFNPFSHTIPAPVSEPKSVVAEEPKAPVAEAPKAPAVEEPAAPVAEEPKAPVKEVVYEFDEEDDEPQVVAPKKAEQPAAPKAQPAAQPKSKQSALYDDDDEDEAPAESRKISIRKPQSRKKPDLITIIALVAVALALFSLVWGMIPSNNALDLTDQYEMGSDFELAD